MLGKTNSPPIRPEKRGIPFGHRGNQASVITGTIHWLASCQRNTTGFLLAKHGRSNKSSPDRNHKGSEFSFHDSDIANRKAQFADSIYIARGSVGPYKLGPGVTGVVGGGIRLQVKDQSVECPAVPGNHYDACTFINKDDKAYIMVLLLKDTAEIAQAK